MLVILYYFTIYAFPSSDPRSMEVGKQKLGKLFIRYAALYIYIIIIIIMSFLFDFKSASYFLVSFLHGF